MVYTRFVAIWDGLGWPIVCYTGHPELLLTPICVAAWRPFWKEASLGGMFFTGIEAIPLAVLIIEASTSNSKWIYIHIAHARVLV